MTSEPTDQIRDTSEQAVPQNYQSWSLPQVSSDRLLSSVEKEARERKNQRFKKNKEPRKTGPVDEAAGESIEVIETIEETFKPLTADQLREITEAAEKEGFDAAYKKGLEAGQKEGEEKGYQTGLDKAEKKIIERCERVEHIIEALLIPLQSERKKLEVIMVDIIGQLTQAVISRELALDSSQILKFVDEAINAVPTGSDKFSLYLNPKDIALVESHLKEQSEKQFNYYSDDDLLPGGCRLETKNTVVSHTVEQRLEKVIDDFINQRAVANYETVLEVTNNLDSIKENLATETPEKSVSESDKTVAEDSIQSDLADTHDIDRKRENDTLDTQTSTTNTSEQLSQTIEDNSPKSPESNDNAAL